MAARLKINLEAVELIEEALRASTFERANFGSPERTADIREATKIYRESWIIPNLDHALRVIWADHYPGSCLFCGVQH